jgi:TPR repeat protein
MRLVSITCIVALCVLGVIGAKLAGKLVAVKTDLKPEAPTAVARPLPAQIPVTSENAKTTQTPAQAIGDKVRLLEQKAANGDAPSLCRLAVCYAQGDGVEKNEAKAYELMSQAAKAGDAEAMYHLSRYYQRGVGVVRNVVLANRWLRKSQSAGYSPKSANTAKKPKPTNARPDASDNKRLAFQKYMRAADAGDTRAMAELGHLYMTGQGTPRDLVKAAEMFRKGSDAGNRRCTHELGLCYAKGVGVTQDFAKAYALFKSGADANDPDSMHDLGICYYYGRGVKADRAEAQKWFTKSAKAGYRPSQQALASIARSDRTPASGKALTPEQARAAVGLLWMFSQMGGFSTGQSEDQERARDEAFNRHIERQAEAQRAETDARIRAREQGIP